MPTIAGKRNLDDALLRRVLLEGEDNPEGFRQLLETNMTKIELQQVLNGFADRAIERNKSLGLRLQGLSDIALEYLFPSTAERKG